MIANLRITLQHHLVDQTISGLFYTCDEQQKTVAKQQKYSGAKKFWGFKSGVMGNHHLKIKGFILLSSP